jgi:AsmA protein
VRVLNAKVRYQDQAADTDVNVELRKLELRNVQLVEPIELLLEAGLALADGPALDFTVTARVSADMEQQRYRVSDLLLQAQVRDLLANALPLELQSQIDVDLAQDTAALELQTLQVADAAFSGTVNVAQLTAEPTFAGNLVSKPIKLQALMQSLAVALPPTASADALQQASLDIRFKGTTSQARLPAIKLQLDNSTVTGSAAITDFTSQALVFDLKLDQINLDHYLPPATDEQTPAPAAGAQAEDSGELFPVELIRSLQLNGKLQAGTITIEQEDLTDLNLAIRARNGKVAVSDLRANMLGGNLAGQFELDASKAQPQLDTDIKVNNVELTYISRRFMTDSLLSGKANMTLDMVAKGNDMERLLETALGNLHLQLDDGVLHGINLNALVVDALRDQLKTVEMLYPDYQEKLPRQLKEDTEITKLLSNARVENGHLIMPKFEFFTGESGIDASGKIDLVNLGFDYDFGVVLSALDRNKYLHGTRWPVECRGDLAGSPADWCRPDTSEMGSILGKAAKTALKDKTAAEIGDKVGLPAADQQQLENEFEQKLKEEEDRAKRKLQEKLDKLFNR